MVSFDSYGMSKNDVTYAIVSKRTDYLRYGLRNRLGEKFMREVKNSLPGRRVEDAASYKRGDLAGL